MARCKVSRKPERARSDARHLLRLDSLDELRRAQRADKVAPLIALRLHASVAGEAVREHGHLVCAVGSLCVAGQMTSDGTTEWTKEPEASSEASSGSGHQPAHLYNITSCASPLSSTSQPRRRPLHHQQRLAHHLAPQHRPERLVRALQREAVTDLHSVAVRGVECGRGGCAL